jgi:phospholipid/cholesterol/gamma-HCH transport system substrate-binding protein
MKPFSDHGVRRGTMKKFDLELAVGLFIIAGILCLGYLSIKLGKIEVVGKKGYEIYGVFSNVGGLKVGESVEIAGVNVGRVTSIALDNYQAHVVLNFPKGLKVQEDAIASVKTRGLIGEKYIEITPGGSEEIIKPGGRIQETQSAVDMEGLISKFVFGKVE